MKKKGLIISTIVMVVVLIASLTTATYAWFSASASAKVDAIDISTTAAEGLEIALNTAVDTYYSGSITFENGALSSGTEGFGASLTMASGVGNMQHAVTKAVADTRYPYIVKTAGTVPSGTVVSGVYENATGGSALETAAIEALAVDTVVYVAYTTGTFLVPISYADGTSNPNSYGIAQVNTNYLWLPIVIRTTSAGITNIYYKVTLTPKNKSTGGIKADMMPGMAAASRITYSKDSSGSSTLTEHAPFSSWAASGSTLVSSVDGGSQKKYSQVAAQYKKYVYYGLLVAGTTAQDQGTEFPLEIFCWIEGTDAQCINATAGSGYTITIEFSYNKAETAATTSSIVTDSGWATNSETQNLT